MQQPEVGRTWRVSTKNGIDSTFQNIGVGLVILSGLLVVSRFNFLLFHGLAELFSIAVAWSVFSLAWNSRKICRDDALLFLGIAYFFIGLIDLVHTLSYKGMGVFPGNPGANLSTQLWIAGRGLETVSLLLFPLLITRKIRYGFVIGTYTAITALALASIFSWHIFPDCYVEGQGLTVFKKAAEYLISLALAVAAWLLFRKKEHLDGQVFRLMVVAIALTIVAELAFTFYVSVYGLSNIAGHFLKIISFFLIYLALVRSTLTRPYKTLFRELEQERTALKESEESARKKIQAILEPQGDIGELSLGDIIDREALQSMLEEFYKLTNILSAVGDLSGNILVAVGWQDICTKFHRCHPETNRNCLESDTLLSSGVAAGTFKAYRCKNNLWDIVTPIEVGGRHIGNIFIGQFFYDDETPDYDLFRHQAREYGFDETEYLAALDRVPRLSRETVDSAMAFCAKLAGMISSLGYSNITLSRTLAQQETVLRSLSERNNYINTILATTLDGFWVLDAQGRLIEVNEAYCCLSGYSRTELLQLSVQDLEANEQPDETAERIQRIIKQGSECFVTRHRKKDGSIFYVEVSATWQDSEPQRFICFCRDITARRQIEIDRENTITLLEVLNTGTDLSDLMKAVLNHMQEIAGCEAVGIRLRDGDDFPYCEVGGFSDEFVMAETHLCAKDLNGQLMCDEIGNPVLECMCGNIIHGRFDPSKPYFTEFGSFISNNTTEMLADTTEVDRLARTRNRCNGEGYESVFLVPLRDGREVLGLLQFNDRRRDCFPPEFVSRVENIAVRVATELARRKTDAELRDKKEEQQLLLENLRVGIVIHAPDSSIMVCNQDACEMLGLTRDQMLGKKALDPAWRFLSEDGLPMSVEAYPVNLVSTTCEKLENYVVGIDAPARSIISWVLVNAYPVFTAEAEVRHIVVSFIDISALKQVEKELKESKAFLDNLNDIAYMADAQGNVAWVNDAIEKITDFSPEEVIGKAFLPLFVEDDHALLFDVYKKTLMGGSFENELTFISGKTCHFTSLPRRDTAGNIVGTFGIARDISELRRIDETIRKNEDRLRKAQRAAKIGNWEYDVATGKVWGSEEAFRIYGIERNIEFLPLDEVENYIPDIKRVNQALVDLVSSNEAYDIEFEIKPKNMDEIVVVHSTAELVCDDSGKPSKVLGVIQDITGAKAREKENLKLVGQLQQAQKMESVGRLAGGVAHDFNNMLGVILGHTDIILEQISPDQTIYAGLKEIKGAAERSAGLTRQLLAFARKQTVAPRVLDLNQAVEGMLNMLRRLIGEDIDLAWLPGRNLGLVNMDPSQIDQMLANLCVNARDAIADIGKITIETGTAVFDEDYCSDHDGFVPGDFVLLVVSDDGSGMDQETLAQVFEPFFTTKVIGKGTGLGLATIYGIVKQNNGFINVYSEPGQGTTFKIYLPRHSDKPEQTQKTGTVELDERGHETILLVEDEPAILGMTTVMLNRLGYTVIPAATPGEAIRLASDCNRQIHLLLTDVVMPEMNGRDLAENLRAIYPNLKRLFMSGYTANVIAHNGVLDKGVNFIQKPFSRQDLASTIREVLEQK